MAKSLLKSLEIVVDQIGGDGKVENNIKNKYLEENICSSTLFMSLEPNNPILKVNKQENYIEEEFEWKQNDDDNHLIEEMEDSQVIKYDGEENCDFGERGPISSRMMKCK